MTVSYQFEPETLIRYHAQIPTSKDPQAQKKFNIAVGIWAKAYKSAWRYGYSGTNKVRYANQRLTKANRLLNMGLERI